jgi:hypothetical protein
VARGLEAIKNLRSPVASKPEEKPDLGEIRMRPGERSDITLGASPNSFMYLSSQDQLRMLMEFSERPDAPESFKADAAIARKWLGRPPDWTGFGSDGTLDKEPYEKWGRTYVCYLSQCPAPTPELVDAFAGMKTMLSPVEVAASKNDGPISDDIRGVFDRMLGKK